MINSAHCATSSQIRRPKSACRRLPAFRIGTAQCATLIAPYELSLDCLAALRAVSVPNLQTWTHAAPRANIRPNLRPKRQRRRSLMNITVGRHAIAEASEKLKNWGRWGKDDEIGTLNHIRPEDIVKAAALIKTGKVFGLGIPLDRKGPQTGLFGGRWNPIHTMLATGTDAVAGRPRGGAHIPYAQYPIQNHLPVPP